MIKPGTVIFKTTDTKEAPSAAREFCKTRGLSTENAKIVKRGGHIEVEIVKPCLLKIRF